MSLPSQIGSALLVVAPVRIYREAFAHVLGERGFSTSAVASVEQALATMGSTAVGTLVLDMTTEGAARLLSHLGAAPAGNPARILALGFSDDELVACVEAGVSGYLPREAGLEELVEAVESLARGHNWVSQGFAGTLIQKLARHRSQSSPADFLTVREREVAELLRQGRSNKDIARILQVEVSTVKSHVHSVLLKHGASRRIELLTRGGRAETG